MENDKNTWGGKRREGPPSTYKTYYIQNALITELEKVKNKSGFVNEAIREKLENDKKP